MSRSRAPTRDVAIYAPQGSALYVEDSPAVGGAERQMALVARGLAQAGLRVCHVLSPIPGLPASFDGVELITEHPRAPRRLPGSMIGRVTEALAKADARVYIQRSAGLATLLVGGFARLHGRAFIYSASSAFDLTHAGPLDPLEGIGFRIGLPLAHAVVVQTYDQLATAQRRRGLVQIPSICEPPGPISRGERDIFLWVGRPARYKNPGVFVELARAVPEARFVMVGLQTSALSTDGMKNPPANLDVRPPLAQLHLAKLYTRAIAVVNTSDFEGFPNTFLEGWAHGALALSLNVDPDGVLRKHRLGICAAGSLETLAGLARELWRDRHEDQTLRRQAVRYVADHHAAEAVANRWCALIQRFLAPDQRYRLRDPRMLGVRSSLENKLVHSPISHKSREDESASSVKGEDIVGTSDVEWIAADPIHNVIPAAHPASASVIGPKPEVGLRPTRYHGPKR
ncbi:MAG TPA: glycosyltransferase family 4 protein [Solirubrobacteraceae bacterium]|nr:glycosyltransferase family 4 protein [Solirubrobacteraceae bacterium]